MRLINLLVFKSATGLCCFSALGSTSVFAEWHHHIYNSIGPLSWRAHLHLLQPFPEITPSCPAPSSVPPGSSQHTCAGARAELSAEPRDVVTPNCLVLPHLPAPCSSLKPETFHNELHTLRDLLLFLASTPPGDHFVECHRERLIQRVSPVDAVLSLLRGNVLNYSQYQSILAEGSDLEKMRKLYELVPRWDTLRKDRFYQALAVTNPALIEELEGK
uniref:CARD domain-containing protein n=1 Tax=Pelusios castaneus TaxID=367368 RepID=A0A8C8RI16_9SAUR